MTGEISTVPVTGKDRLDEAKLTVWMEANVAGIETAKKLVDESLPSNELMARWAESAPKV